MSQELDGKFIVKLQTALFPKNGPMLAYPESRAWSEHIEAPEGSALRKAMEGTAKKFFYARTILTDLDPILEILEEAPWQDW